VVNWYVVSFLRAGRGVNEYATFVAQLKINLRPLWSPAAAALATLSVRFGDVVWGIMFSELRKKGEDDPCVGRQARNEVIQDDEDQVDEIWEDERSWRDPSAHKLRVALAKWLDSEHRIKGLRKVRYVHRILLFITDVAVRNPIQETALIPYLTNINYSLR
jgi:hypothetical protein